MTTPLFQQALEALERALEIAQERALEVRAAQGGYMNLRQKSADEDVARIRLAITAIQAHLSTSQAEQVPDWRVYLEFSTNDVLVRVGEKSWTFKEHGSVYGAMQKIVPALLGIR